jgi:hypothetical protein
MSSLARELRREERKKRDREAAESRRREREDEESRRREEESRQSTSKQHETSTRTETGTRRSTRLVSSQRSQNPPMISDQELRRNWTKVSETATETVWTQQFENGEREYRQKRYYLN